MGNLKFIANKADYLPPIGVKVETGMRITNYKDGGNTQRKPASNGEFQTTSTKSGVENLYKFSNTNKLNPQSAQGGSVWDYKTLDYVRRADKNAGDLTDKDLAAIRKDKANWAKYGIKKVAYDAKAHVTSIYSTQSGENPLVFSRVK